MPEQYEHSGAGDVSVPATDATALSAALRRPRRSVARQFSFIALSRIASAAVQAAVGVALARSVDPEQYGFVTAVAGAALFWFIACDLGISSCIGRARAMGDGSSVDTALFISRWTSVLGGLLAVVVALPVAAQGMRDLVLATALIITAQGLDKNIDAVLAVSVADGDVRLPATSQLLRRLVTAAVFAVLVGCGFDAVAAYSLAVVCGPLAGHVQIRAHMHRLGVAPRRRHPVGSVLRRSAMFAVNDIAIQSRALDVGLVAVCGSVTGSGLYASAAKLTSPFQLVSSTLAAVLLPRAARSTPADARRAAVKLLVGATLLVAPMLGLAALSGPIVLAVLGEGYAASAAALAVLLVAMPYMALPAPLASLLQGVGEERSVAVNGVVFAGVILAATGVGALLAGATGAAVGVAAGSALKVITLAVCLTRLPSAAGSDVPAPKR
ncbi:lipopolysaccharide biosynthesis protein [Pseudonocardia sichuanensis]